MTTPCPPRDSSVEMTRLIDASSRIRSLHDDERSASFERWERRKTRADSARHRRIASAGIASALALAGFVFSLDGSSLPQAAVPSATAPDGSMASRAEAAVEARAGVAASGPSTSVEPTARVPREGAAAAHRLPEPDAARRTSPSPRAEALPPGGASVRDDGAQPRARRLSLGGRGELDIGSGAKLIVPSEAELAAHHPLRIRLERGRVEARVAPRALDEPFAIATPHLEVVVVGTRFSVAVDAAVTTVRVEHGRVRVEKAGHSLLLDAGQTLRSDDARFDPAPRSASPSKPGCSSAGDPPLRRECLARAAAGSGLEAQNALLSLGLLERELGDRPAALARFREYQRRHPRGVLAPEVALALVQTLMREGQPAEARAAAENYARRFPDDADTAQRLRALAAGRP
jgi:hypothetical protein